MKNRFKSHSIALLLILSPLPSIPAGATADPAAIQLEILKREQDINKLAAERQMHQKELSECKPDRCKQLKAADAIAYKKTKVLIQERKDLIAALGNSSPKSKDVNQKFNEEKRQGTVANNTPVNTVVKPAPVAPPVAETEKPAPAVKPIQAPYLDLPHAENPAPSAPVEPVPAANAANVANAAAKKAAENAADKAAQDAQKLNPYGVGGMPPSFVRKDENYGDEASHLKGGKKEKDCEYSVTIDGKYACKGTKTAIKTTEIAATAADAAGNLAQTVVGTRQNQNAMQTGGAEASARAGANTAKAAGITQLSLGAGEMAFAALNFANAHKHKKNSEEIYAGTHEGSNHLEKYTATGELLSDQKINNASETFAAADGQRVAQNTVNNFELNQKYDLKAMAEYCALKPPPTPQDPRYAQCLAHQKNLKQKENLMGEDVRRIGGIATTEQDEMADLAKEAAMKHAIKGAQQLIQGAASLAAAKNMKDAADLLKPKDPNQVPIAISTNPPNMAPPPAPNAAYDAMPGNTEQVSNFINPNPAAQNSAAENKADKNDGSENFGNVPGLGGPIRIPNGENEGPSGPPASPFNPGAIGGPGIAGGGGGGGIQTQKTANDQGGSQEPGQSSFADVPSGAGVYSFSNGGGFRRRGGPAKKGDSGASDFAKMLAQFLPKKDDEGPKKDALEYLDRKIASGSNMEPGSILSSEVNIFERIHEAYQDKSRRGHFN
jgi:hypothetical protein